MIVTQKSLSRRTVLRGLGATVALPLPSTPWSRRFRLPPGR